MKESGGNMPNLSLRKLDEKVYRRLRLRAAKHGVSMEEEARRIINLAVTAPENLKDIFIKYFGPENGIDLDLQRQPHHQMDFHE